MAGLDPAIHVFRAAKQDVDARDKAGHDGVRGYRPCNRATNSGVG
jgi:hypothetical protein